MNIDEQNNNRKKLNTQLTETDDFFKLFGSLDDIIYSHGAIPKNIKN